MNCISSRPRRSRRRSGRTLFATLRLGTVTVAAAGLAAAGLLVASPAGAAPALPEIRMTNLTPGISMAQGINNRGEVVIQGAQNAFRWTPSDGLQYLVGPGGRLTSAWAINDRGQVAGAGVASRGSGSHAKLWTPATGVQDLGALQGDSFSLAINEAGMVAGDASGNGGANHAFRWTPSGGMMDLGTLGGRWSHVVAMNDRGDVVGISDQPYYGQLSGPHAFVWTPAGGMRDLGNLPGGFYIEPFAMNNCGQVVGQSRTAAGITRAFLWTPSTGMQDLGNLGGNFSTASGINAHGQVTGSAKTANGWIHAFVWSPSTGMKDLDPKRHGNTFAAGINDLGAVAGTLDLARRAFLWTPADGMRDLGTLGGYGTVSYARGINNRGQVIGDSTVIGIDGFHATLWTPSRPA